LIVVGAAVAVAIFTGAALQLELYTVGVRGGSDAAASTQRLQLVICAK
jgi:hypothetical protein